MYAPNMIEFQLKSYMKRVANNGGPLSDDIVDAFGEEMKSALRKQFQERDDKFKVRPSNIGRPLCQLWFEKNGYPKKPFDEAFLMRMLIGDAVEAITRAFMRGAGINVTSHGDDVTMDVAGQTINGTSDIDVDGKVYDIKSASEFSVKKFASYEALKSDDSFGYIGQLNFYADAQNKDIGGWIVVNKNTGNLSVLEAFASKPERDAAAERREYVVKHLNSDAPLERQFSPEPNTHYGKETGEMCLPKGCTYCDFVSECYPEAERRTSKKSNQKSLKWFMPDAD